jgi:hypothetical protein
MATPLDDTINCFSVRIDAWYSPRLVTYIDGFVYLQVSTCFPCEVCNHRVEILKRKLHDGAHSRFGLAGNEILHGLAGHWSYNIISANEKAIFVFPYAGPNIPKDIADFLTTMLLLEVTVEQGYGQVMPLPSIPGGFEIPDDLSPLDIARGMESVSQRLIEKGGDGELMKQQSTNKPLLIAALVLKEGNIEESCDSLINFAQKYPLEDRMVGRALSWGGWDARKVEQVLYGYYYNADTVLYISQAQPEPQLLATRVKRAYDHTIRSHLNESIDHGRPFHKTVYYRLHQEFLSHLPNHGWSLANLPTQIKEQLPPVPEVASEGELVTWLYTLENPSIYEDINSALVADDEKRLRPWMPMIVIGTQYAEINPFAVENTTYRGSRITKGQFDSLRIHAVYRDPKFVSTSLSKAQAERRREIYLCEYKIREGCRNAVRLTHSFFKIEAEVVLPPYTPLLVTGKDDNNKVVYFSVLGRDETSRHLETEGGINAEGITTNLS